MTKTFLPSFPYAIENCIGERLIFLGIVRDNRGERIEVENFVQPGCGPAMHVHHRQDEALTVIDGRIGYQVLGGEEKFAGPGETVSFSRGTPHRFWNAGKEVLHCKGYITPPDSVVYFLTRLYQSVNENGGRPGAFDSAWLLRKYRTEFDVYGIPGFVRNVIFPLALWFGLISGKAKKFADAPDAVN
jgi:quercetin dioxygenase-like cupin family protein